MKANNPLMEKRRLSHQPAKAKKPLKFYKDDLRSTVKPKVTIKYKLPKTLGSKSDIDLKIKDFSKINVKNLIFSSMRMHKTYEPLKGDRDSYIFVEEN